MNRLHINHILAIILLPVGAMTLMMFASLYQSCQRPNTDTVRIFGVRYRKVGRQAMLPRIVWFTGNTASASFCAANSCTAKAVCRVARCAATAHRTSSSRCAAMV